MATLALAHCPMGNRSCFGNLGTHLFGLALCFATHSPRSYLPSANATPRLTWGGDGHFCSTDLLCFVG